MTEYQLPTGLDGLIRLVADLGKKQEEARRETNLKLDELRDDWNKRWADLPDDYPTRREINLKLSGIDHLSTDHETRLRQIEAQLPTLRLDAFRETTATREQVMTANTQTQAKVAEERKELDARTIVLLASIPSLLIGLLTLLFNYLPHLTYHP